jgi:quinol monooxygenase YgiN
MHSRVTTAQLRLEKLDHAVSIIREMVVPAVRQQRGFQSLQLIVDRETGEVLLISHWASAAELEASATQEYYRNLHVLLVDHLVGPPETRTYEVALLADMDSQDVQNMI